MAPVYHERQSLQLCAKHSLNNLGEVFTKSKLDEICNRLVEESHESSVFNPHRSIWGTGNYDVNAILSALQQQGFFCTWFDKRREFSVVELGQVFGVIVNTNGFFGKHWFAIRKIDDVFYNLDSKLLKPTPFAHELAMQQFVQSCISSKVSHVLLVTRVDLTPTQLYRRRSGSGASNVDPAAGQDSPPDASEGHGRSASVEVLHDDE